MIPTRRRLLAIGVAVSVVVVAVSVGLSVLTEGALPWQGVAIALLALAALLFVSRMVVSSGSGMSVGFGDPHEVYIEAMARSASEHGLTGHPLRLRRTSRPGYGPRCRRCSRSWSSSSSASSSWPPPSLNSSFTN